MTATRARRSRTVPVPKPRLTPAGMIKLAEGMRGLLRSKQEETEKAARVLDDVHEACVAKGFYRILQPRRFGGYEFDLPTFARVAIEISRGCPSTGWSVIFTAGHTHVLAKFPEQAQMEVYGSDGEFRGPFVGSPGVAEPVEGGYLISGQWDYASGIDVATHFFASCAVSTEPGGARESMLVALLDRDQFDIEHNWEMLGMQGSGSHRVIAKDVFVPEHRASRRAAFSPAGPEPGGPGASEPRLYDNPMYLGPSGNILMAEIAAVAIGTGYGALDCYEEILKSRTMPFARDRKRAEEREFQVYFGNAMATLDTAKAALLGCTQQFMDYCKDEVDGKERFTPEKSARIVLVEQQCCRLAGEAIDLLFRRSGSSEAKPGRMMQRYYRDISTLLTHVSLSYDRNYEQVAKIHLGIETPPPATGSAEAAGKSVVP
jgi:3-hydroxy-9,10-secoandrosta-1,3,5(10)-triene-9,17-dione monooxygenase